MTLKAPRLRARSPRVPISMRSLVLGAPRPRYRCSAAHFDTGQVEVVFPPLDVHGTNQATARLNDLSTSVLHPRLMERLLYVLVPGAKTSSTYVRFVARCRSPIPSAPPFLFSIRSTGIRRTFPKPSYRQ
jgi:hypothetical protein